MLDFNAPEFLVVAMVALLVIGPKDLPKALRFLGKWVGKARGVARQFRTGIDTMIRESELADMEKQWAAENERIMRQHPPTPALAAPQPMALTDDAADPVMVEQLVIHAEPAEAPAPKPRKRKAPSTGDTLEAPKPAPARKPRAKAQS
ncbi:Sec-independent protein translocase protein TatB [Sphingomonas sp. LB-2]|uniref:Sec-independent protein translocase protein TatB n=1 Tax=Sphingomonas caeni TaxID=2984949 RepID=UPI0022306D8E|nr:Sec-independent protein translocase protein TatB [Sphingomonas caeni]MCW3847566.1 Sec-independent protein translocase protein TatB [Sphingomonas caeni]